MTLAELSPEGRSQYDLRVGGFLSDGRFTNEDGNWVYAGLEGALASQQRLELWRIGMEDLALLQLLGNATEEQHYLAEPKIAPWNGLSREFCHSAQKRSQHLSPPYH